LKKVFAFVKYIPYIIPLIINNIRQKMIKIKNRDNLYFEGMDPLESYFHPRKLELLKKSWAEVFRNHVLPQLPVAQIAKNFDETMGRPTKELRAMCGACVLQQFFDLTDAETRDQLSFNQQWHYALDVLDQDDQIVSLKTLWSCRFLLLNDELAKPIFDAVTDNLAEVYDVDPKLQRLDSVHIHSNMARLGRTRLLSRTCTKFLMNLKRHYLTLYQTVADTIISRYTKKDDDPDYFGNTRPSQSQQRLEDIATDIYELTLQFQDNEHIQSMYSYKLLLRVFKEQCSIANEQAVIKPATEVSSDSLQNPSDVDASYDGHKGQGYQVQVMETYAKKNEDADTTKQPSLQLITYVAVEPAHCHDSAAIEPALDDVEPRQLLPDELEADTLYGSQENVANAKQHNVTLVAPTPGKKPQHNLSEFSINPTTTEIESCPAGHEPASNKHNNKGSISCVWGKEVCQHCHLRSECCVKETNKAYLLRYTRKEAELTIRRQYEQCDEFKDKYRYRSGIEASISRFIHMTGARRLRYRGLKRVDYAARLKVLGINIFRTAKFLTHQENQACFA
jgi:hypothetical protein